jgi:hypothetical protein
MFTINNPEGDRLPEFWPRVVWCIWQREKGAEGTEHLQGYVVVHRSTLAGMKKVHPTAHWEPRRGSHEQAKEYCSKLETRIAGPWECGVEPQQGKRTDLLALKDSVDGGASNAELAEAHFTTMAAHYRWINQYRILKGFNQRSWPTFTTVLWGPTGSGKTRQALEKAGIAAFWMMKPGLHQTVFFDGYDGQPDVVIDEFYGWIPYDLLLRMLDRYPLNVHTKGGAVSFCPKRVFITSNKSPDTWYPKMDYSPLLRRLSAPLGDIAYIGDPAERIVLDNAVGEKRSFMDLTTQEYDSDGEHDHFSGGEWNMGMTQVASEVSKLDRVILAMSDKN